MSFNIPQPGEALPKIKATERAEKIKQPKRKCDPVHVAAARELRDRYLEKINQADGLLPGATFAGKYDVARAIGSGGRGSGAGERASIETKALPQAA